MPEELAVHDVAGRLETRTQRPPVALVHDQAGHLMCRAHALVEVLQQQLRGGSSTGPAQQEAPQRQSLLLELHTMPLHCADFGSSMDPFPYCRP